MCKRNGWHVHWHELFMVPRLYIQSFVLEDRSGVVKKCLFGYSEQAA